LKTYPFRTFLVALGILVVASFTLQSLGVLNPDVAWINYGNSRMLAGARLYVDIVEVNPPTIYYLSMPPFWLSSVTGIASSGAYIVWVLLLAALSSSICYKALDPAGKGLDKPHLAMCLALALLTTVLIGESFGQREHFLIMFLSPYVFLKIARLEKYSVSHKLSALIGVLTAIAVALKPHYVAVVITLEALQFYRQKHGLFSSEVIVGALTGLAMAVLLMVFHPEFMSEIVALGRKAYLPYYRESTATIVNMFGLTAGLIAIYSYAERRAGFVSPGQVLLAASAASAVAMLLQFRGFPYQILVALFFLLICSAFWIFSAKPTKAAWIAFPGIIALTLLLRLNSPLAYQATYPPIELTPRGSSVAVFSTNIRDGFPFAPEQGLIWTSRFPSLWFMSFLFNTDRAVRMNLPIDPSDVKLANALRKQVVDDLINAKPDRIMVRVLTDPIMRTPVDYLATFSKDPRFGSFFKDYTQDVEAAGFIYYRRKSLD
jgi:hypothetical protein